MSRPKTSHWKLAIWAFAMLATCSLWFVSLRWNICYAGDFGFLSITDGYVILPATFTRTWGDWGWWTQSPWGFRLATPDKDLLPVALGSIPQMGAMGVSIPFAWPFFALLYWPMYRLTASIRKSVSAALMFVHVAILLFVAAVLCLDHDYGGFLFDTSMALLGCAVLSLPDAIGYRRRSRLSLCAECAYDLRYNTSGVCPECGTAVTMREEAKRA